MKLARSTGTCYGEIRAARDSKSIIAAGYDDDEYAKAGEEWKFSSRKILWYDSLPLLEGRAEQKKE